MEGFFHGIPFLSGDGHILNHMESEGLKKTPRGQIENTFYQKLVANGYFI